MVGIIALVATLAGMLSGEAAAAVVVIVIVIGVVFAAVYHAEVVAHRVGEPFGTLVLAVAVTVIEVALIVSIMLEGGADKAGLARDTVFAAVVITCCGIVGICLLAGGVRHYVQGFQFQGALTALAVLVPLTVLTLIVPNVTVSSPGSTLNAPQLVFSAILSLVLYGAFVFVQTIRHRDYFLPPEIGNEEAHVPPPSNRATLVSLGLLIVSLAAVIGLAKALSPTLEGLVLQVGAPKALVGIIIAALVLMPEGLAAYRAAQLDRLQTSMNLALGSALASIGLTVPAVAAVSILLDQPLQLGLGPKESILLGLTLLVSVITLGTGRTTVLQGIVHLSIFVAFLFYAVVP
ncbi:MAG: ionic transporter y4hA [Novosphingobium sp. 17-62-19]|uniref:calcium:proton antiporter n=1 Tax=Novosphingobium sp. 17-62-19 TaxID=1970406 RepID=UPI000BC5BBDC|nr:ionic transporter y4hA [Novosphingobium sp. 17-62-19]OZA17936.1 MAG: ionic transporter y4hA [Novosphingobium sp. 17-62-19]